MTRIAIVGAGAAGVFTAYRLKTKFGNRCTVELYEAKDRVGGNAYSVACESGGRDYSIDAGAQFFDRNPQARYVALLEELGLVDDGTEREIIEAPAGFTIWDSVRNEPTFHVHRVPRLRPG